MLLLLRCRRIVGPAAVTCWLVGVATAISVVVVVVAAVAAACWGGGQSTGFGLRLRFAGAIVTNGEFIVVSCRLMLYHVSNDLPITRR
jgi:hypothetical protein